MFSGIKSISRTKKYSFDTSDLNKVYGEMERNTATV